MKFGLSDQQMDEIIGILVSYNEIEEAILFGSRAMDTYKEASDIDIALKGVKIDRDVALKVKSVLDEETSLPFFFDVVAYSAITSENLKEHIKRKGKVLYRRGWKRVRLGDVTNIIGGFAFKSTHLSDKGDQIVVKIKDIIPPFIDVNNATKCYMSYYKGKSLEKFKIKKGDYIVAMTGATIGKVGKLIENKTAYINQRVAKINPHKNISKNFIYYSINDINFQKFIQNNIDSQSVQENISATSIGHYPIWLPPVEKQRGIAEVLSSLDDKIELLHRQNRTLEDMAQVLFRKWFIEDTDPTWPIGKLGDIINLQYGKGLKGSERALNGIYPVVGSNGCIAYHKNYLVHGPGIVIGRKGTLGKITYLWSNFFPIDTTFYVKSKIASKGLFFEYFLLKTIDFEKMNTDSAVPGLNRNIALSSKISIPPTFTVQKFNKTIEPLFGKKHYNQIQIQALKKLRDMLLPKLINGDIRIRV